VSLRKEQQAESDCIRRQLFDKAIEHIEHKLVSKTAAMLSRRNTNTVIVFTEIVETSRFHQLRVNDWNRLISPTKHSVLLEHCSN
jgi:hypothetical protein